MNSNTMPQVVQEFREFKPRADFRGSVERLLEYVPPEYLVGLESVVLKDRTAPAKVRWDRRNASDAEMAACYLRATKGRDAVIEMYVDVIMTGAPRWLMTLAWFRELMLSKTFFHEIGHHVHRAIAPDSREPEAAANYWRDKLGRDLMRRRFWFLVPLRRPLRWYLRVRSRIGGKT